MSDQKLNLSDAFQAVIDVYRDDLERVLVRVEELEQLLKTYQSFEHDHKLAKKLHIALCALGAIDNRIAKEALNEIRGIDG